MALMQVDFFSDVLGLSCEATVILPQREQGIGSAGSAVQETYPVLWLLHGMSDDHTIWSRRTSIERYVSDMGIAVVMPNAHLSFYSDMVHGPQYFTFITQELPAIMQDFFSLSSKREDNFVCGLSMGGYGAMKLGLSCPEQYAAIGCLSAGNFPHTPEIPDGPDHGDLFRSVWGAEKWSDLIGTEADLYVLAERALQKNTPLPRIFHACGTEDFLYPNVCDTRDWFQKKPFDYTYHEAPGIHEWGFWDHWIQEYLQWLQPNLK